MIHFFVPVLLWSPSPFSQHFFIIFPSHWDAIFQFIFPEPFLCFSVGFNPYTWRLSSWHCFLCVMFKATCFSSLQSSAPGHGAGSSCFSQRVQIASICFLWGFHITPFLHKSIFSLMVLRMPFNSILLYFVSFWIYPTGVVFRRQNCSGFQSLRGFPDKTGRKNHKSGIYI